MRLWRAKRRQTAYTQIAPNTYAKHKRKQKTSTIYHNRTRSKRYLSQFPFQINHLNHAIRAIGTFVTTLTTSAVNRLIQVISR